MNNFKCRILVNLNIFVIVIFFYCNPYGQTTIADLNTKFETNKVSVLLVYTSKDTSISQGSAFLISQDGLAISNYHVFKNSDNAIAIDYKGNKYNKIANIYANPYLDFILFKIEQINLPPLKISKILPAVGDPCFTIGNPMGLDQTLSTGIISGYRSNDTIIQTSAEITFGSSGGPLFNSAGEVIGITSAGMGQANLNFAINLLQINLDDILKRTKMVPEEIVRDYLSNLGKGDFKKAYELTNNPLWIKKGGLSWFQSQQAFGAITSLNIKEIRTEKINNTDAIIFTEYYAEDPLHASRTWQQFYYLQKNAKGWEIVKVKLK